MYTASTAFLEALQETGVSYLFCNLGSDHPALIEAIAEGKAQGRKLPQVITCPNEMVALSSAQGYAQVTGQAQAVIVHVECGTQALAGAVHNVARGRIPVFIFAGLSPFTQDGELRGSRNEFIQWIQDVHDQRGIVREYVKYDNEFRTAKNVKPLVRRAMQFAHSDPKGPVYLVGAREVMEEECEPAAAVNADVRRPLTPAALPGELAAEIARALARARRPLIVTSYAGRNPDAVAALQRLAHRLGAGVLESVPNFMNYPHDDELYLGNQWNQPRQNPELAQADVILVADSDVPWIPTISRPAKDAVIYHVDVDALKTSMPLWYLDTVRSCQADAATAFGQIHDSLKAQDLDPAQVEERRRHYAGLHGERARRLQAAEQPRDAITPESLTAAIRRAVGPDAIVLNEGITNYPAICDHMAPTRPGHYFNSGGGSLGWNGGAAVGVRLARPDKLVVALTGDGSYLFSVPSSVHWMARRYEAPFLQVVYNNGGWQAPRFSALSVHPAGYASRTQDLGLMFDPDPDYSGIAAAAGGAFARRVTKPGELDEAIAAALHAIRVEGRAAVLDVMLPRR